MRNQNCGLFFRQAALCYNLLLDCGGVLVSIYLHSSKEGSLSRSDHRSDSVSSVSFERSWKTTTAYVITLCINNLSQITHISPTWSRRRRKGASSLSPFHSHLFPFNSWLFQSADVSYLPRWGIFSIRRIQMTPLYLFFYSSQTLLFLLWPLKFFLDLPILLALRNISTPIICSEGSGVIDFCSNHITGTSLTHLLLLLSA